MYISLPENHQAAFKYESGAIDWCEPNYLYNTEIAEFWNTLSNIVFLILGYFGFKYCRTNSLTSIFYLMYMIYIMIGMSSMYFHATLSLVGQLLDEISIYLLLSLGICFHTGVKCYYILFPVPFLCIMPQYNPYMLFVVGIYIVYLVLGNYSLMTKFQRAFGTALIVIFTISSMFWIFDKICYFEGNVHTHFIFHILIAMTGFSAIIFLDYVDSGKTTIDPIYDIL